MTTSEDQKTWIHEKTWAVASVEWENIQVSEKIREPNKRNEKVERRVEMRVKKMRKQEILVERERKRE